MEVQYQWYERPRCQTDVWLVERNEFERGLGHKSNEIFQKSTGLYKCTAVYNWFMNKRISLMVCLR